MKGTETKNKVIIPARGVGKRKCAIRGGWNRGQKEAGGD